MLTEILMLLAGLVLLVVGAEWLVRGASRLAARIGIPPLIVGLTIVAFGTSAPELAVSTIAAGSGASDIALGNVLGSNVFNILLVLGLSACLAPLRVHRQLVRRDVPVMTGTTLLVVAVGYADGISSLFGAASLIGLAGYTVWLVREARHDPEEEPPLPQPSPEAGSALMQVTLLGVGLALLLVGAQWLVDAATAVARTMGVSDLVIGLTIVAGGTSLPEAATSIVALLRGNRDIAVGNVVGSNIFNLLGVLGLAAVVSPDGIEVSDSLRAYDLPIAVTSALICLPVVVSGAVVSRFEGSVLVATYFAYIAVMLSAAAEGRIPSLLATGALCTVLLLAGILPHCFGRGRVGLGR